MEKLKKEREILLKQLELLQEEFQKEETTTKEKVEISQAMASIYSVLFM